MTKRKPISGERLAWSNPGRTGAVTLHCAGLVFFYALSAVPRIEARIVEVPVTTGTQIQFVHLNWGTSRFVVRRVVEDNYGFLWLGANDALRRYDGYGFMRLPDASEDPVRTGFMVAETLMKDRSGRLWFSSYGALRQYDPATGKTTDYVPHPGDPCGAWDPPAVHISEDREGTIWLATVRGLRSIDPATSRMQCYQHRENDDASIESNMLWSTLQSRDGSFWIASETGLEAFDPRAGKVIRRIVIERDGQPVRLAAFPGALYQDRSGLIWTGLSSGGDLASIDPKTGAATIYSLRGPALHGNAPAGVVSFLEDGQGDLWLGTSALGLLRLDAQRKHAVWFESNPDDPLSPGGDLVVSLASDHEGSFWAVTKGGDLYRFDPHPRGFRSYRRRPGDRNSLIDNSVLSALEDRSGVLWVGSERGLNRMDRAKGSVERLESGPFSSGVRSIAEDHDGYLWFGTRGNGLLRYDPRSRSYRTYRHSASDERSLGADYVAFLLVDRMGTLWAAHALGIDRFNPATQDFRHYGPPKSEQGDPQYHYIAEDRQGALWLARTGNGLDRFDRESGQFTHYGEDPADKHSISSDRVFSVFVDHSGTVWAATFAGLDRFNRSSGSFTHYTERNGLPANTVLGIQEDENGYLWVSTSDGLARFDPRSATSTNYHSSDGLPSDLFSVYVTAVRSRSGEMFFGSYGGLLSFFPNEVTTRLFAPPVVLTGFRLSGEPITVGRGPLDRPIWAARSLTLAERSIFSFEFSALSYIDPARNVYRYRLEGLEDKWNEADSARRVATYTTLPSGDYTFRVEARTGAGAWSEGGVALKIRIPPPWYGTWWFRTVCAVAFVALLWLAYRFRVRRLRRAFKQLQEVIETIPAMAWTARPDGSNAFVNRRWAEYIGLSAEDAAGSGWIAAVHPDDRQSYGEKWRAFIDTGEPFECEARFRCAANGEYRWLLARGVPLRDGLGNIVRWYGTLTDIEDLKRAEQERERLREFEAEMAHINRVSMMGELATSVAHEVNQPLTGIVSNGSACIRLLAGQSPNVEEALEALRDIVRDGKRAGEVIARIRAMTKRAAMPRERLDLNGIIREVLVLVADEAKKNGVVIRTQFADDLCPVSADRVQMQQVVLNLVINAMEAMSSVTGRQRELVIETRNMEDGQVRVTVEDTGIGLDPKTSPKMFEPFYTTKSSGMGMGLSICRSIIESHGGRLWATAKDGPGTSFHFTLPQYHGEEQHARAGGV